MPSEIVQPSVSDLQRESKEVSDVQPQQKSTAGDSQIADI